MGIKDWFAKRKAKGFPGLRWIVRIGEAAKRLLEKLK